MRCLILILCVLLTGCGYNKSTFIKIKGDKLKVPIQGLGVIEGEGVEATLNRAVNLTTGKRELSMQSDIDTKKDTVTIK